MTDNVVLKAGHSFYSANGVNWEYPDANVCVKAFTYNAASAMGNISYQGTPLPETQAGAMQPAAINAYAEDEGYGFGMAENPYASLTPNALPAASPALPASFDLRDNGAVSAVENQGSLGSCWTFATYGSAESVLMRSGNMAYAYPATVTLDKSQERIDISGGEQAYSLSATVTAPDDIGTNLVFWSFAGDVDAIEILERSSESGQSTPLLKAKGTGTVTIRATSAADTSKSASMTLTIVDDGYIPGLGDLAMVSLAPFYPTDGKLTGAQWQAVLDAIPQVTDGQALVVRFYGEILIPKAVFEALHEAGIPAAFVQLNTQGGTHLNAVFDGKTITAPADYLLGATYTSSIGAAALVGTSFPIGTGTFPITYSHSGPLPGPAVMSLLRAQTPFAETDNLYYYGYTDGGFNIVTGAAVSSDQDFIRIDGVTSASEYLLANRQKATDGSSGSAATTATTTGSAARTGDDTNMPLLVGIALASVATLLLTVWWKRGRYSKKA